MVLNFIFTEPIQNFEGVSSHLVANSAVEDFNKHEHD